eukprot:scaffold28748_cov64-Phaeocystis_antarctica.AAC.12
MRRQTGHLTEDTSSSSLLLFLFFWRWSFASLLLRFLLVSQPASCSRANASSPSAGRTAGGPALACARLRKAAPASHRRSGLGASRGQRAVGFSLPPPPAPPCSPPQPRKHTSRRRRRARRCAAVGCAVRAGSAGPSLASCALAGPFSRWRVRRAARRSALRTHLAAPRRRCAGPARRPRGAQAIAAPGMTCARRGSRHRWKATSARIASCRHRSVASALQAARRRAQVLAPQPRWLRTRSPRMRR